MSKLGSIAIACCLALAAGGCATGASRPLGRCSAHADRRPVAPSHWPGGMEQLLGKAEVRSVEAPAPGKQPAASARTVTKPARLSPPPPAAPTPLTAPVETAPPSLEINPTLPTTEQKAERVIPANEIVEVRCDG